MSAGNYEEDGGIRSGSEFGSPDLSIIPEDGVIRSGSVFGSPKLPQNFSVSARRMDLLGVENMLRSPDLLQNFWCNQTKCKYFLSHYSHFLSAGNYEEDGVIRSGSVFGSPNLPQNFLSHKE